MPTSRSQVVSLETQLLKPMLSLLVSDILPCGKVRAQPLLADPFKGVDLATLDDSVAVSVIYLLS